MLRRLYDWTMGLAGHRHALAALAVVAFVESSIFPIPPDVLLIPMVLASPTRAWRIALVCTAASVAGGLAGYGIGLFLFETVGRPLIEFYSATDAFGQFQAAYAEWGAWIVGGAGLTPFPYKVITILSGVMELDITVFTVTSAASRGLRFFAEAALLWHFGQPIRAFIEGHLGLLTTVFFALLIGGFALMQFIL